MKFSTEKLRLCFSVPFEFRPRDWGLGTGQTRRRIGRARDASWMRFSFLLALLTDGEAGPALLLCGEYVPRYVRPAGATGQGQPLARVVPTHLATPASIHPLQRIELAKSGCGKQASEARTARKHATKLIRFGP